MTKKNCASKNARAASNESTKANLRAKNAFFNTVNATMSNYEISAKKKFSILTKLMKNQKISNIPPLIQNNNVINDSKSKSEHLNDIFVSKAFVQGSDDQGPATLYMSSDAMQKRGKYNNDIHRPKSPGENLSSDISSLVSF